MKLPVAVIGDVMLDEYVYGDVHRISPESASPVLHAKRVERMIGGAGNVARGVAALDCDVELVGVVGNDPAGRRIMELLKDVPHITPSLILDPTRETVVKTRYVSDQHSSHLLRVDHESVGEITYSETLRRLSRLALGVRDSAVVVLSDYCKGVFIEQYAKMLIPLFRPESYVIVDSKRADLSCFQGANLVKLNLCELGFCFDDPDDEAIASAAYALANRHNFDHVLVTLGERGMTAYSNCHRTPIHYPGKRVRVRDVSGAGDTVVATLAAQIAQGTDFKVALEIANRAASLAVSKPGTAVVTAAELRTGARVAPADDWSLLDQRLCEWARYRIGFTNGCFDMLHPGHVHMLTTARTHCDKLIVGVNSDASVRRLKGATRPIQDVATRAAMLDALDVVDLVVVFESLDPTDLIERIHPYMLFKGGDYTAGSVLGREYAAHVQIIPLLRNGLSTTDTINKIKGAA